MFLKICSVLIVNIIYLTLAMASDSLGPQRLIVALYDLSGSEDQFRPLRDDVQKAIFDSEFSVARFFDEASYGKASVSGTVLDWATPKSWAGRCAISADEVLADIGQKLDLRNFERVLVGLHRDEKKCVQQGIGLGESTFGRIEYSTLQGRLRFSVAQFLTRHSLSRTELPRTKKAAITGTVVAHELLHSFGIQGHANVIDCGLEAISKDLGQCKQEGIADVFSALGGEGFYRPSLHPSACHKQQLGWLGDSDLETIDVKSMAKNTPKDILLRPYAGRVPSSNGPGFYSARINLENPIRIANFNGTTTSVPTLFLEYRIPLGFDQDLVLLGQKQLKEWPNIQDQFKTPGHSLATAGLQIRGGFFVDGKCVTSYLVDAKPESLFYLEQSYSLYDALDSLMPVNATMNEPNNNLTIKVLSVTDAGLRVQVVANGVVVKTDGNPISL